MKFNTVLSVITITATLVLAGCATGPTPAPSAILTSPQAQAIESTAISGVTAGLVMSEIKKDPSTAPAFAAGGPYLTGLASGNAQITPQEVDASLAAAGQTNSTYAAFAPLVVNLLNTYTAGSTNAPNSTTAQILSAVGTGMTLGVAMASPK